MRDLTLCSLHWQKFCSFFLICCLFSFSLCLLLLLLLLMAVVTLAAKQTSDVVVRQDLLHWLHKESVERNATIIYATHIFDGLDDWPTHLTYLTRDGSTGWQGRLEELELNKQMKEVRAVPRSASTARLGRNSFLTLPPRCWCIFVACAAGWRSSVALFLTLVGKLKRWKFTVLTAPPRPAPHHPATAAASHVCHRNTPASAVDRGARRAPFSRWRCTG